MKMKRLAILAVAAVGALTLNSCETATGTGALIGAGAGALIGNSAGGYHHGYYRGGNPGGTIAGAAIGAGAGALIGAAIDANRAREYGPEPAGGYPWARRAEEPGLVYSPYPPHRVIDVRGIPHGALVRDPESGRLFRRP
jgi:predicted small secreted protein